MTDIKWTIEPDDVEWEMDWTASKMMGKAPDKPFKEMIFEPDNALAHLLLNGQIHTNSYWWKYEKLGSSTGDGWNTEIREDATWTKEEAQMISFNVNCNDVFAWACSDSEALPHKEIETLYRMWIKDPMWGTAVWCMVQRNQMPQGPVEDRIRKAGIWDLDKLGLGKNTQDSEVHAYLAHAIAVDRAGSK